MLVKEVAKIVPKRQAEMLELRKRVGNRVVAEVTVNQVIGGMRGIPALITEVPMPIEVFV